MKTSPLRASLGRIIDSIGRSHIQERQLRTAASDVDRFDLDQADQDLAYALFEEFFRGSSEVIASRQERYLPWLERASKVTGGLPVVDVGCGRGEVLTLCREHGIAARGVDINDEFYGMLKEQGFDVIHADALEYLRSLEPASLGGIISNSVIEHLAPQQVEALVRIASRVIAPGGCLVLESNNTESPYAMGQFWLDPTHVRPYHAQTLLFWMSGYGFRDGLTQYRTPVPWRHRRLFGRATNYQEFTVVGYKPEQERRNAVA